MPLPYLPPLSSVKFTLSAWGAAGLFGGEEAISAVALAPLFQGGRWLGWYNSPGSLEVARYFGRLALHGQVGPKYISVLSGTEMQTGYLGYLTLNRCKEIREEIRIAGREVAPVHIALIELGELDGDDNLLHLAKINILLILIPIAVSVGTCGVCALVSDWYSYAVILVGILAGGVARIAIGSGRLDFQSVRQPVRGSAPPGDGILVPLVWEDIVVVLKGSERSVNAITRGTIGLELGGRVLQRAILISSVLLVLEFVAQLIIIPKGTLFGQLMIVISLCVSWVYNSFLSSLRRERLQANILFRKLGNPQVRKFLVGNRVMTAVLTALLVFHDMRYPSPLELQTTLRTFIPIETEVWERWRRKVVQLVRTNSPSCLELDEKDEDLEQDSRALLRTLLQDARAAFEGYLMMKPFGESSEELPGMPRGGKIEENLATWTSRGQAGVAGGSRVPLAADLRGNTLYFMMEELDGPLYY